ncbi:hypothetical protein KAR48_04095 [bacterium]|nr:hypothetical protein [bacterium]
MRIINIYISVIILLPILHCKKSSAILDANNHEGNTWEVVYEVQDIKCLSAIDFVNENVGWAVGDSGTIIHTNDGGITWKKQESAVSFDFRDTQFLNESVGWVVGSNNTALKTTNGGREWSIIKFKSDTLKTLMSLHFIDSKTGWIVDNWSGIWHTTDGGDSWSAQESGTHWAITAVQFFNKDEGWAITTNNIALHTINGGNTWESILIPSENDHVTVVCIEIFFIDKEYGWMAGWYAGAAPALNPVYYTSDSGLYWTTQIKIPCSGINSIVFLDRKIGWIAGRGKILFTFDGGNSWNIQHEADDAVYLDLCFVNESNGWAVGYTGKIYKYIYSN